MRSAIFFIGRMMQILGMGTVLLAFVSFFYRPSMGDMFKLTVLGVVEFYIGNLIVARTGIKNESREGTSDDK